VKQALKPGDFVLGVLDQAEGFILGLPEGAYAARVEAIAGSLGGHLRHCLEHLAELLHGLESGEVFFENRKRDLLVSGFAQAGLAELGRLRAGLSQARETGRLELPLIARSSLSGRLEESVCYPSSAGRELVYVGLHFIHHMALMATAARLLGVPVDTDLGKAPATLVFEKSSLR
jgi:hypothetical protein